MYFCNYDILSKQNLFMKEITTQIMDDGNLGNQNAWLLTWNPKSYVWDDIDDYISDVKSGKKVEIEWICKSKKPQIGDHVFLMMLGVAEKSGIIAHGTVSEESFEAESYAGKYVSFIGFCITKMADINKDTYILQKELKSRFPEQVWTPQCSGIQIKNTNIDYLLKNWLIDTNIKSNNMFPDYIQQYASILRSKKNLILQGAPGTGKTYNTAAIALAICEQNDVDLNDHAAVMERYEELRKEGQIAFTTFHQSMDYEDFVEGIKPIVLNEDEGQMIYKVENGIFKKISLRASFVEDSNADNFDESWQKLIGKLEEDDFIDVPLLSNKSRTIRIELNNFGTGLANRTYENDEYKKGEWINGKSKFFSREQLYNVYRGLPGVPMGGHDNYRKAVVEKMKQDFGLIEYSCSHVQNITIQQAIELFCSTIEKKPQEIKSVKSNSRFTAKLVDNKIKARVLNSGAEYPVNKDELYKYICSPQNFNTDHKTYIPAIGQYIIHNYIETNTEDSYNHTPHVLIIDEINRGNVSKIFGELITILEADKRSGSDHPITVTLPYSKEPFSVPSNLYIIGTMNTTDRSVGFIDYAVRRRFAFATLKADRQILIDNGCDEGSKNVRLFDAVKTFLENHRADMDIDDLMVGHSYFMAQDVQELQLKLQYEIIPLIQEYAKDGIINVSNEDLKIEIEKWLNL